MLNWVIGCWTLSGLNPQALAWCVLTAALAWAGLTLIERRWLRRSINRLIAHLRRDREGGEEDRPRCRPESQYIVRLSDFAVSCRHPDGATESVAWDDLQKVELVTTDHGPFIPDVFWVLHGSEVGCVVPVGATGERELLQRLQLLPGFRNEAVIEAMSSTDNRRFLCWQKTQGTEPDAAAIAGARFVFPDLGD